MIYSDSDDSKPKELVILGAGPHSLTLLLRLLDEEPDLLDEGTRARLSMDERATAKALGSWTHVRARVSALCRGPKARAAHAARTRHCAGTARVQNLSPAIPHSLLATGAVEVIDPHGEWLGEWHRNFAACQIAHLRSPADMHPGPHDMRELLAFAKLTHRDQNGRDLVHMAAMGSDRTYKGPFVMPSTALFADYVAKLIDGYQIRNVVTRDSAVSLERQAVNRYAIRLASGRTVLAKRVVCALGPNLRRDRHFWAPPIGTHPPDALVHPHELADWLLQTASKSPPARILLVGGGITSAHVVRVLLHAANDTHITMLVRSELRVRQFDLHQRWFGPHRRTLLDRFHALPLPARTEMLRAARGGGSMPPESVAVIARAVETGRLTVLDGCDVSSASWGASQREWEVSFTSGHAAGRFDTILTATGADVDINEYPVLQRLRHELPIAEHDGFPAVQADLRWSPNENVYVLGALAALQLGPDALNLAGARHGACRVARTLRREIHAEREREEERERGRESG